MRIISQRYIGDGQFMLQLGGLSSETKPTDAFVATGSQFFEDDTDAVFTFSGLTWNLEKNGQMKDLPVVTSTDNGKVLKVANGVWSVGEGGGGGGAEKFVVTLAQDAQTEEWTADKTIAKIVAAKTAGKEVVIVYNAGIADIELRSYYVGSVDVGGGATASAVLASAIYGFEQGRERGVCVFGANIQDSDTWFVTDEKLYPTLPDYSSTPDGKVLGLYSGSLAWVDTNAPLIVTLTAGQEAGQFVGDKTHQEAYDAFIAGRNVVFYAPVVNGMAETVTAAENNTSAANPYALSTKSFASSGAANDYISVTAGG